MSELKPPAAAPRPKPAFIPQPAKPEKPITFPSAWKPSFNPSPSQVPSRKRIIIVLSAIFFLIIIATLVTSLFKKPAKPPITVPNPPRTSPPPATITPEITPQVTNLPTKSPTPTIEVTTTSWNTFNSQQGGFYFSYPQDLSTPPSTNVFQELQPIIYEDSYYFDCLNRQLGTANPYACWLINIDFSTADASSLLAGPPQYYQLPDLNQTEISSYADKLGRTWTLRGPDASFGHSVLYAQLAQNQVVYQLKTQMVTRSMQDYLRNHPHNPFGFDLDTSATEADAVKFHQLLVQELLSNFKVFRKPFITEPRWLQVRVSNNWSVAYPENWQLYKPTDRQLLPDDEGLFEGWYGSGESISFHRYAVHLATPNLSQYPASARQSQTAWKDYLISMLTSDQAQQVSEQLVNKRYREGPVMLLNYPDLTNFHTDAALPDSPVHLALIWKTDKLPIRMITIKQLDGLYESDSMARVLEKFTKLLFE